MALDFARDKERNPGHATSPRAAAITSERFSARRFLHKFRPKASLADVRVEARPGGVRPGAGPAQVIPVVGNA